MRKKIRRGELPLAADWNGLLDDVEALKRSARGHRPPERFFIKNDSGADVDKGGVLGISGLSISPADNEGSFLDTLFFTGVAPTLATYEFNYAVALEPIADGAVGRCALDGLVRVRLNLIDTADKYAIVDGTAVLASHWYGNARIVALEDDETLGEQWAVVKLNDPSEMKFYATTGTAIAAGNTGVVTVLEAASGSPFQRTTGEEAALEDVTMTVRHLGRLADSVAADTEIQCERLFDGSWVIDVEYCPAS